MIELSLGVFISYNQADRAVAREIAMFLVAENINVWFDEWKISPGDSIIEEIQEGLSNCSVFIVVWSKNAAKSKWVRKELETALIKGITTSRLKIVPIRLDNEPLPPFLQSIKYIRWRGGTEEDRNEIVRAIKGKKPEQDYIRAIVKKYHEVIIDSNLLEEGAPLPYKACPECGSTKLRGSSYINYSKDEEYFLLKCRECGWRECSQ